MAGVRPTSDMRYGRPTRYVGRTRRPRRAETENERSPAEEAYDVPTRRLAEDEVEAEEIRAKVRDLKTAQLGIKSNKEMQQSIIQIESLEHEAEAAENRALALQADEMPSLEARVREAQEKVDAEKGGVDGFVDELDQRLAEVKAELAQLAEERKALVAKVTDPKMRLYYERIRTKRWPAVVLLTDDGVCDGCHLVQPPSVAQMVQHNQGLVACTMCGRILYRDL